MEIKKIKLILLMPLFVAYLISCELFESTTVSSKEIKKASSWSSNDQSPNYPECEALEKIKQMECFQSLISEQLMMSISEANLVANAPIEASVVLRLKVDKKGIFSLVDLEVSSGVSEALPNLETTLEKAVAKLPQALPATKTNVGVYVATQFTLPIQISAQASE
jgi:hypothetical protein